VPALSPLPLFASVQNARGKTRNRAIVVRKCLHPGRIFWPDFLLLFLPGRIAMLALLSRRMEQPEMSIFPASGKVSPGSVDEA
jgi:hypothetical protein